MNQILYPHQKIPSFAFPARLPQYSIVVQDPLEIRHLRYFLAVAEAGSFSRAANRLGVSQPNISQQMRDLEIELRVPLFQRRGKRILGTGRIVEPGPVVRLRAIRDEIRELAKGPLAATQPDLGRPPAPWREQLVKRLVAAGTTRAEAREALQPDALRAQARKARERAEVRTRRPK